MAEELRSYPVPNLVQGVSQQAPQNRRDTQCAEQFDCINSPINGCEARPGVDFKALLVDAQYQDAFFFEIKRGTQEHYLVVVLDGDLEAYDLDTGDACTISFDPGVEDYLACFFGPPKNVFRASTLEDFTFLLNREVIPEIDDLNLSEPKRNEAIIYWKAGGYMITFQLSIRMNADGVGNDDLYSWTYRTPDNSVAGNAEYITTNAIASTFYRSLTGTAAVPHTSGGSVGGGMMGYGVGAANPGQTGAVGDISAVSLGFNVALNGNCILIWREDDVAFTVDTADGVGDTYMRAVKDQVQGFADLPKNAFEGFTTKIKGTNKETADDYFVRYFAGNGSQGYWQETVAPATPLTFREDTMPITLISTAPGEFELRFAVWGVRVAGDGVDTALDPTFVGQQFFDIFYDQNRLALLAEGSVGWSKLNNPFVFFPSSAQTILATDPVDVQAGGGRNIVLLRKAVQSEEQTFLWAQKKQFRAHSGQESFRQDTVEIKPSTSFEFAEVPDPLVVATSLYFASEPGLFATLRDLSIVDGRVQGGTDITGHVKKYVRSGIRFLTASDTLGLMLITSDQAPSLLYVYNFLIGDNDQGAVARLQSAWNTWRLPVMGDVLWVSMHANLVFLAIQRPEGVILASMDLSVDLTDAGHDDYLTRLDLKMTEANCTVVYDGGVQDRTAITLPFDLLEGESEVSKVIVTTRTTNASRNRGALWEVVSVVGNVITVVGNAEGDELHVGLRIVAERTESPFYLKGPQGYMPVARLQVMDVLTSFAGSGYFRVEVTYNFRPDTIAYHMAGRIFGSPENAIGSYVVEDGQMKVPINAANDQYTFRLVNDSYLPSRWQTMEYQYVSALYARPAGLGGRGR